MLHAQLLVQDFVVLDGFNVAEQNAAIKNELKAMYNTGEMKRGLLAGGRTGKNLKYSLGAVRGDFVAWVDGKQPGQENLQKYVVHI